MASLADYNEWIQRELQPDIIDTVIYDTLEPWVKVFGTQPYKEGDRITGRYRTAHTSNAGFYDKSDVDPAASTQTLVKPYWTKVFAHGAFEVHGIDMSNAGPSVSSLDLIADAASIEAAAVANQVYTSFFTQIKKDVDSSSVAYSDASLSRSTHAKLVSYEEATDATITLAYMRAMIQGVTNNKYVRKGDYICLMEDTVYNTFKPLAAAVHTWNTSGVNGKSIDAGYQDIGTFEGLAIAPPEMFPNMTTGDVLMLRKQDVKIVPHRPMETKIVESGRDSIKGVIRMGYNVYVDNPYLQGKMTDKD